MQQIDGRTCTQCKEEKAASEFSWKGPDHKRLTSRCHSCRRANYKENPEISRLRAAEHHRANREAVLAKMKARRRKNPAVYLLRVARKRASERGLPFNLTIEDVVVPIVCPVIGIPLVVGDERCGPASPTLDRVIPALGYVRGNVVVISHRANTIKSDATLSELLAVARYVREQTEGGTFGVSSHAWAALGVAVTAAHAMGATA